MLRFMCLLLLSVATAYSQVPGRELATSDASVLVRMEAEGSSGQDPAARLQIHVQQWSQALGPIKPGSQPQVKRGAAGTAAALTVQFANEPKFLHAFLTMDTGSSICHVRAASGLKTMFAISTALQRCSTELQRGGQSASIASATASTTAPQTASSAGRSRPAATASRPGAPPKPLSADQPPAHADNWNNVAEVLFRTAYGGGYGGLLIVQYEPLILFRDGTYFEAYDAALEDLDLQQERQVRPVHFGRWRRQGATYILTDNRGRPDNYKLQDGNLFRAFPAEQGGPLRMRYKSVSGGGNSAMGGDVGILITEQMSFAADGRFAGGRDVGILGSGNTSGVSMAGGASKRSGVGSYKAHQYTIELRYPDGRSQRRFFAYASSHDPAVLDHELVFLGDTAYVHDK